MKKTKKIVTLALAAVLLVGTTVAATVAYLQDETEVVKNTFTVGNVEIDLDEALVTLYGKPATGVADTNDADNDGDKEELIPTTEVENVKYANRVKKNEYKLIPGHTYTKDPTVHVELGSEESYVFMKVVINNYSDVVEVYGDGFLPQDVVNGWEPAVWVSTEEISINDDDDTATYIFYYHEKVTDTLTAQEPLVLEPLFTEIVMDGEFDYDDVNTLKNASIDVTAYAIQADGFELNETDLATMQEALGLK